MRTIFVFILINALIINVFSQEKNHQIEPKGTWKVSKEYDDQGNMIAFDSVYVWSSGYVRDFDFLKNDSLPQHFKGFIRDFEMPKINWQEGDSLALGMRDFFEGFEFPEMNFQWFENDSLHPNDHQHEFFNQNQFDFQKQIDELKKQIDDLKKSFEEKQKSEAIEPKKIKENKM